MQAIELLKHAESLKTAGAAWRTPEAYAPVNKEAREGTSVTDGLAFIKEAISPQLIAAALQSAVKRDVGKLRLEDFASHVMDWVNGAMRRNTRVLAAQNNPLIADPSTNPVIRAAYQSIDKNQIIPAIHQSEFPSGWYPGFNLISGNVKDPVTLFHELGHAANAHTSGAAASENVGRNSVNLLHEAQAWRDGHKMLYNWAAKAGTPPPIQPKAFLAARKPAMENYNLYGLDRALVASYRGEPTVHGGPAGRAWKAMEAAKGIESIMPEKAVPVNKEAREGTSVMKANELLKYAQGFMPDPLDIGGPDAVPFWAPKLPIGPHAIDQVPPEAMPAPLPPSAPEQGEPAGVQAGMAPSTPKLDTPGALEQGAAAGAQAGTTLSKPLPGPLPETKPPAVKPTTPAAAGAAAAAKGEMPAGIKPPQPEPQPLANVPSGANLQAAAPLAEDNAYQALHERMETQLKQGYQPSGEDYHKFVMASVYRASGGDPAKVGADVAKLYRDGNWNYQDITRLYNNFKSDKIHQFSPEAMQKGDPGMLSNFTDWVQNAQPAELAGVFLGIPLAIWGGYNMLTGGNPLGSIAAMVGGAGAAALAGSPLTTGIAGKLGVQGSLDNLRGMLNKALGVDQGAAPQQAAGAPAAGPVTEPGAPAAPEPAAPGSMPPAAPAAGSAPPPTAGGFKLPPIEQLRKDPAAVNGLLAQLKGAAERGESPEAKQLWDALQGPDWLGQVSKTIADKLQGRVPGITQDDVSKLMAAAKST